VTLIGRGGDPTARLCQMTFQLLRDPLIAAGLFSFTDFNDLDRAYDDPSIRPFGSLPSQFSEFSAVAPAETTVS
jgi:hypothetical protein